MSDKNTGGPAFPQPFYDEKGHVIDGFEGMTLRDYFAAKAMSGMLAGLDRDARRFMEQQQEPVRTLAKACYTMADAMLAERDK